MNSITKYALTSIVTAAITAGSVLTFTGSDYLSRMVTNYEYLEQAYLIPKQEQLEDAVAKLTQAINDVKDLKAERDNLEIRNNELTDTINEKETEINTLSNRIKELEQLVEEGNTWQQEKEELEARVSELQARVSELQAEIYTLYDDNAELETTNINLVKELTKANNEVKRAYENTEKIKARIEGMEEISVPNYPVN